MSRYEVIIERLKDDIQDLVGQFAWAMDDIGLAEELRSARKIFIKPNLTYPVYREGVTTRGEFVRALVVALIGINPGVKVYIGEGEGGYNSYSMDKAFADMGFCSIAEAFEQVEIVNLSKLPVRQVVLETGLGPYVLDLPVLLCDEIDFSISCPVPKVHCMTKISLAFKNLWGCLPDAYRLRNHYMINHLLPRVSEVLKFRYAFLDGKFGLDRNGPLDGDPVELNWFGAANSLGAFDRVIAEMMGFDWQKIPHLKIAGRYGFIPERDMLKIVGRPAELGKPFVLKRELWNYPALSAFRSRCLTHLFYFSPLAKPLHDIMYLFRKRPM